MKSIILTLMVYSALTFQSSYAHYLSWKGEPLKLEKQAKESKRGQSSDSIFTPYIHGLNAKSSATIEQTLHELLILRIDNPGLNFTPVMKKIEELSLSGKNSSLRYKAYVTFAYLKDTSLFIDVEPDIFNTYANLAESDRFYVALGNVLQDQLTVKK